jgi:hypothetical protein
MYTFFDNYVQAKLFMDQHENAKLAAWACGKLFDRYAVFIPKVNEDRRN